MSPVSLGQANPNLVEAEQQLSVLPLDEDC